MENATSSRAKCLLLVMVLIAPLPSCFLDNDSPPSAQRPEPCSSNCNPAENPTTTLQKLLKKLGHTGKPRPDLAPVEPADDDLVKLGQVLFFSRTLSGDYDVACATCHHPRLGGADRLSLPVGVSATSPLLLGPGRRINPALEQDPLRQCLPDDSWCGPNVPRNSPTTFNAALYENRMFLDGRIEWLDKDAGQIRSAESGHQPEIMSGPTILGAQARLPVVNPNEMRGFANLELADPNAWRNMLTDRLKGIEPDGVDLVTDADAGRWLELFRRAFGSLDGDADTLINWINIQAAMDAYQRSTTFTDTPWANWVAGNSELDLVAIKGARLFFSPEADGGLGCAGCHSGNNFSDELMHNTGVPQFGRGKRPDGQDLGREDVDHDTAGAYAFRTPSLLNITLTAPYMHTGAFEDLGSTLRYHANPSVQKALEMAGNLPQFIGVDIASLYPDISSNTQAAINAPSFNAAGLLPLRELSTAETEALLAFLATLTDPCAASVDCVEPWIPTRINGLLATGDDPDGHLLVAGEPSETDISPLTPGSENYPQDPVAFAFPATTPLINFPEISSCDSSPNPLATNSGSAMFTEMATGTGLLFEHAFSIQTWLADGFSNSIEDTMMSGGLSATYINDDCWPDLVIATGDTDGLKAYLGSGSGTYTGQPLSSVYAGERSIGAGIVDVNGDFRREIFVSHLVGGETAFNVLAQDDTNDYLLAASLPMYRNTWGIAFADTGGDGYPEIFMGHWDQIGLPDVAPALWRNIDGTAIQPWDAQGGTGVLAGINQTWQFSPAFADFNQDGAIDLAVVSDFGTTSILQNNGLGSFANVTDRAVITDENGMGAAIGDYDNDGLLDLFVSSVYDPNGIAEIVWGVTGNRLYRNVGTPGGTIVFEDVTSSAGVADGLWGWAACLADFDNDGWQDIFHENGYGYIPPDLILQPGATGLISAMLFNNIVNLTANATQEFFFSSPRLFMNDGPTGSGGTITFTESALTWNLDTGSNGRGVVCNDLDRDGDVDMAVLQNSAPPLLHINQHGYGPGRHFLGVRLVGTPPNTDALGSRVVVTADTDGSGGIGAGESLTRLATANSNFLAQNLPDMHFGLGMADHAATVTVHWPDGSMFSCNAVVADQFIVIDQRAASCP